MMADNTACFAEAFDAGEPLTAGDAVAYKDGKVYKTTKYDMNVVGVVCDSPKTDKVLVAVAGTVVAKLSEKASHLRQGIMLYADSDGTLRPGLMPGAVVGKLLQIIDDKSALIIIALG